jgi:Ca2+-transporting ATPase
VISTQRTSVGLTSAEAHRRLLADGRNEVPAQPALSLLRVIRRQLRETVILVLLAAAALTAAVGDATDTAVILAVVVLNTALGVVQEIRSERALTALAQLMAPRATVVRDGQAREVDAAEVVLGDVVRLAAGDIVPADALLLGAESLQLDEAALTGESLPVDRAAGDRVLAGTVVTRGRGEGVVEATAGNTEVGGIARAVSGTAGATPVQRQLSVLGRRLAAAVTVIALVVAALDVAAGRGWETSVVLGISLAVAAIPESLPAVVSLALAMAARRMSAIGVLVRRLPAVEALGSVTVLATDKTGTLTEGRLAVVQVWTPGGDADARRRLLEAGALCNDAADGRAVAAGSRDDPLEVALVEAARREGIDVAALRARSPRVAEQPFDAASARMTTVHESADGTRTEICKGSPEALLPGTAPNEQAKQVADALAAAGRRVLAVTSSARGATQLLGLFAFSDPPRASAAGTIAAFTRAGVRPVMITGDHPATAHAVAEAVGIGGADGRQAVFARVRPDHKRQIVAELQSGGELVAMTGDGVNDAAALRAADVGVSMGRGATEVARQAADLVLTSDDLSAMVPAIAEGRRAYDNLRRFLHYAVSGGLAEVIVMLAGTLAGFAVPLQAGQLLWVNLLTHGLPGVAMGNEPAADDVLSRPPRPVNAQLLDRDLVRRVASLGTVIAASCLAVGILVRHWHGPWQSAMFMTLAIAQLFVALALRPRGVRWSANYLLPGSVLLNLALVALAVGWAPLRELLHVAPVAPRDVLVALAFAVVPAVVAALSRGGEGRRRPRGTTGPGGDGAQRRYPASSTPSTTAVSAASPVSAP